MNTDEIRALRPTRSQTGRVLVVEDETITARDLVGRLQRLGHEVVGCTGFGEEAAMMALRLTPDLVFMDIILAGRLDGIETANRIRKSTTAQIVFLTAFVDDEKIRRASSALPQGYLVKPVADQDLRIAVELALCLSRAEAERRRVDKDLRRLARMVSSVSDPMVFLDVAGKITAINDAGLVFFQETRETAIGRSLAELIPRDLYRARFAPILENTSEWRIREFGEWFEAVGRRAVFCNTGLHPVHNPDGSRAGWVIIFRDATELKQAEETLRRSYIELEDRVHARTAHLEAAYRSLNQQIKERLETERAMKQINAQLKGIMDHSPFAIFLTDSKGRLLMANQACRVLIEREGEDLTGLELDALWPQEMAAELQRLGETVFATGRPLARELSARHPVGYRTHMCSVFPVRDEYGSPFAIGVLAMDITDRKRSESDLRESEATLRSILNGIDEIALLMTADGHLLAANEAAVRKWDLDLSTAIGRRLADCLPKGAALLQDSYWRLAVDTARPVRFGETRGGGQTEYILYPIQAADGRVAKLGVLGVDVTRQKEVEQELVTKARDLEDANTALKVLLKHREDDRHELEQTIMQNVQRLIRPHLDALDSWLTSEGQREHLTAALTNLDKVVSPFVDKLASAFSVLTPKEIEVAAMIRDGKSSKEIARLMGVSPRTVQYYRNSIRAKLGLKGRKANLRTQLLVL